MNVLTKRVLLTEDPDTPPDLIFYTITSEPRHGHLESSLDSGTAIKMFTQGELIDQSVVFKTFASSVQ